jgi:endonuclease IV
VRVVCAHDSYLINLASPDKALFRKSWVALLEETRRCDVLGLERLRVIHMNDSKRDPGSRVDRHEHIGRGRIGKDAFGFFLNDRRLARVPKILETPRASPLDDRRNLKRLRSLVKGNKKGRHA